MNYNIDHDWIFTDRQGRKKKVDLPYDAMIHEKRDKNCLNGINSGYFPGGKYAYEKELFVGNEEIGKVFLLHFEGVYQNCVIYVNDLEIKRHKYGFSAFEADITEAVKTGRNILKVVVDNSLEPNCRWYTGSGIYRSVILKILDPDYIDRFRVRTIAYDPAVIEIEASTVNHSEVKAEIRFNGEIIYDGKPGLIEIRDARLWDNEHPDLYDIRVYSDHDEQTIHHGIRKLEWSAKEGLMINGKEILLRGGCIHHDHGVIGANEYYDSEYRRISLLKAYGFNAVRMAHNQASEITLKICDELGMYVMNEAFDGWYIPKTYHDYSRYFKDCWKEDLASMVSSSFNHSCVILYSIGNEVSETADEKGCGVCGILRDYVHELDDSRPVTAGINVLLNVYNRLGMGVYKEKGEYRPEPLPQTKNYKEKKNGSAFFNAMAQKLGSLLFFMSKGSKGDKACKGAADHLDIIGLNYASSRYDEDVKKYPDRLMVGSETMVADLPYNWERVKKYPQLIGDFVWSAWDYLGEACMGDWTYASYPGLPLLAGQGMVDITGKALASMYYMQIVWGLRKEPYIGLKPLNHNRETPNKSSWQFTNAIDSYSWQGYEGQVAEAEVYADGEYVQLDLNGKVLGKKKLKKYKTVFRFVYQPGTLTATVFDHEGVQISTGSLVSAGQETILSVRPEKQIINEDELLYVQIEFTDRQGNLKPYIEEPVTVTVEGSIELLGLGSALCKSDDRFDSDTYHSYRGRLLAVIKGRKTGPGKIRVRSQGYEETEREVTVENGEERVIKQRTV